MISGLTVCLLLSAVLEARSDKQVVTVTTNTGVINGFKENVTFLEKTSTLHMFLGIPFAEPPVGDLRFRKPVPKSPLTEPLDAFAFNNACMQLLWYDFGNTTYSEDCLYLNIYAPERDNPNETLPVMVWIYGGGFNFGESNGFTPDRLSIHGDVIVVTLNYRLSLFGFLSTGDDASPGNYGLWDQRLAIEWVHNNIAVFGGDPNSVTIFGESAGSASVIYQGLYHENFGLFQRIIAQSGSTMGWWASTDKGPYYAKELGSLANCSTKSSESIVTCLRKIPSEQLVNLLLHLPLFIFFPTIDNDFIRYDPQKVFHTEDRQSIEAVQFLASLDLLTGVNAGEGAGGLDSMFGVSDPMNFLPNRTDFEKRLVPLLVKEGFGDDIPSALNKAIIAEYTNWTDPSNSNIIRDEFMRMHADFTYNAQLYKTLDTHSDTTSTSKTYMYFLDTEPDTHVIADIPWYKKAIHGDDVPLVFGFRVFAGVPFPPPAEWEIKLSATMMTLWTNFAKSGDPNSPVDLGLDWKPYTMEDQHYLQITRNMSSANVKQRWNIGAPYFWLDVVPAIIQSKTTCDETFPEITSSVGSVFPSGVRPYSEFSILLLISIIAAGSLRND